MPPPLATLAKGQEAPPMISLRLRVWDRILSILFMLIAVFVFAHTYSFEYPRGAGAMVDIALFPRFLAILLFVLGLLLLLKKPSAKEEKATITKEKTLILLYVGLILYTAFLSKLGFLLASFLWILFVILIVGERKWWIILLTAFFGPVLGYYIFQVRLGIPLPEGVLFSIQEFF